MKEIYKQFENTPLFISNYGNYYMDSYIDKAGKIRKPRMPEQQILESGHVRINIKHKMYLLHKMVYQTFVGLYDEKKYCIHHIDHNPQNNNINNLVLMSISEHLRHHKCNKKRPYMYKSVNQYDLNGNLINTYNSLAECSEKLNCNSGTICKCCKGKIKTYKGFKFEYT